MKRKKTNQYSLTLNNIYPTSVPSEYNIGKTNESQKFVRGYEASIDISYTTNINSDKQNRKYQFYIVNNYLYQDGKIHRNWLTNTLTFDLVYKGDNLITLNEKDMRLSGFSGDIKFKQNKKDKKRIQVKITNVHYVYGNNTEYRIYMAGGTSVTSYGEMSNGNTIILDIDLEFETILEQICKNHIISTLMLILTGISTFVSLIINIKSLKKRNNTNE